MVDERRADRRRVVITGWGAVTPLGLTADETWDALVAGRSGIREITSVDVSDLPVRIGGEVIGFDPAAYLPHKVSRRTDRYAQYALAAALQAVEHAGLRIDAELAPRTAVLIGSGYGPAATVQASVERLRTAGPRSVSPYAQVSTAIDSAPGEISLLLGIEGPTRATSTACASGTDAIGEAARWIQRGDVRVALAGGAEHVITRFDLCSSANARALSTRNDDPVRASRPFDNDRDGFVMGAGAGVLVLEDAEHAAERGAVILGEIAGYAATSDAHHWTAPHPDGRGVRRAMRLALRDARLDPTDVDYINAHGTSTPLNDAKETAAIREVFGDHATAIPVSSTKSMTGHLIGAAGAVELIATGHVLGTGIVPPTLNCDDPLDREMNYVPNEAQEHDVRVALSNSFGFGGHNAVLVVRRWEQDRC